LSTMRPLLEATDQLVIATGIVNVWNYEPAELAAEFWELDGDFPDRLLLGIGIGHPEATSEYQKPLAKMRAFLDGLATAERPVPRERMTVAALGPKMLDLSFERTLGTHPYFTPPAHTKFARERLGPNALVAPELAVVVDDDHLSAKIAAREYAHFYLGLSNYTSNLLRFGFTEDDLENGGSERLIDEIVPQGSAAQLAPAVQSHLDAGADHVCVQVVGVHGVPADQWRALGQALIRT
ncbi:MAG TPA: TIGR03620 family F420-dependent LLM class oxidoreductase, partial [Solirubrobacteraceae bacterium]